MENTQVEEIINELLTQDLDINDTLTMASTDQVYAAALTKPSFWKRKTQQDYGDLFALYHLFDTTTVEVAPDLKKKYANEPPSWRDYYMEKHERLRQANPSVILQQLRKDVEDSMAAVEKCIEEGNTLSFNHLASKMLWILDLLPRHGDCYYVIASILFHIGHDNVDYVLEQGKQMDPTCQSLINLENDIKNDTLWTIEEQGEGSQEAQSSLATSLSASPPLGHHNQQHHHYSSSPLYASQWLQPRSFDENRDDDTFYYAQRRRSSIKLPVLDPDGTALSEPLLQVLETLFAKFDVDQDDALRNEELDRYVFSTNGQHPSEEFLAEMGKRFGCNDRGWLTKEGFLAFYLEQTLGDQDETRKDIAAHGYDRWTLRKL